MSNGQLHDDKLFQGLHDRLSDYEAPYNGADWDAMNRSLDQLPKTNQFRWKFSLNTIGIMLGIAGLTAVGVVIASGNDNKPRPAESTNVTVTVPSPAPATNPVQNVAPQPAPTDIAANNTTAIPMGVQEMNSHKDLNNPKRNSGSEEKNPFRLGDQIDPAKGFVFDTKEDPALMKGHQDLKQPEVYYDIDDKGKIKPIIIKHDSADGVNEIKQDSAPQPPANGPEPAAPTDGQRIGFDN